MSILGKTTSMFYPSPKMPKDNKTDISVFGKMASTLKPLPTPPPKKNTKEKQNGLHICRKKLCGHAKRKTAEYRKGTVSNFISMPPL